MCLRPILIAIAFLGLAASDMAEAGAWMRPAGESFLSFGADIDENGAVSTLFAERGIGPRLMLGLDAWHSPFGDWSLLAVATTPILEDGANRVSASLSLGLARAGGREGPQARLGVHLGRGLDSGWLASDLTVTHRFADGQASAKATATWGRTLSDRCAAIFEVRAETRVPISIAPSVACRVSDAVRLRLGGAQNVTGSGGALVFSAQAWVSF